MTMWLCHLRARCPWIFTSILIELNAPRDEFSSIDRANFCHLGTRILKSRFGPLWYRWLLGQGFFYIRLHQFCLYLHKWVVLRLWIVLTIGESTCLLQYSNWYNLFCGVKISSFMVHLVRSLISHYGISGPLLKCICQQSLLEVIWS